MLEAAPPLDATAGIGFNMLRSRPKNFPAQNFAVIYDMIGQHQIRDGRTCIKHTFRLFQASVLIITSNFYVSFSIPSNLRCQKVEKFSSIFNDAHITYFNLEEYRIFELQTSIIIGEIHFYCILCLYIIVYMQIYVAVSLSHVYIIFLQITKKKLYSIFPNHVLHPTAIGKLHFPDDLKNDRKRRLLITNRISNQNSVTLNQYSVFLPLVKQSDYIFWQSSEQHES